MECDALGQSLDKFCLTRGVHEEEDDERDQSYAGDHHKSKVHYPSDSDALKERIGIV
jgi:hypothetical protein